MERVHRLAVYEIVNFDVIDTTWDAEYELVNVIEGSTPDECLEKEIAAYDRDRFAWMFVC